MEKRQLGDSDLYLSSLGMGCWAYGGGAYWGAQSQQDVDAVVRAALDQGINYFDTAEAYNDGASERSLGLAFKGRRHEAVIGTKVSTSNTKAAMLREHCEASLKRLNTDYIDLYMLHWPINPKAIEHFSPEQSLVADPPTVAEAFATLEALRREGKIRAIGVSNHGVRQMTEVIETGVKIVANELPYNLISRAIEPEILPFCVKNGVGVLGYMALQQGVLAGIYPDFDSIPPAQAHSRHFHQRRGGDQSRHGEEGAEAEIQTLLDGMKKIAADLNLTVPALALAWAMANRAIACTLVGSRNVDELKLNIATASYRLAPDVITRLNQLSDPVLAKLGANPDYYESRSQSRIF